MTALSEHTGGVRWGDSFWLASYASWPFAHLLICDDRLILTYPEGAYDFPRASVVRLSRRDGWVSRALRLGWGGLRIEHASPITLHSCYSPRSISGHYVRDFQLPDIP